QDYFFCTDQCPPGLRLGPRVFEGFRRRRLPRRDRSGAVQARLQEWRKVSLYSTRGEWTQARSATTASDQGPGRDLGTWFANSQASSIPGSYTRLPSMPAASASAKTRSRTGDGGRAAGRAWVGGGDASRRGAGAGEAKAAGRALAGGANPGAASATDA